MTMVPHRIRTLWAKLALPSHVVLMTGMFAFMTAVLVLVAHATNPGPLSATSLAYSAVFIVLMALAIASSITNLLAAHSADETEPDYRQAHLVSLYAAVLFGLELVNSVTVFEGDIIFYGAAIASTAMAHGMTSYGLRLLRIGGKTPDLVGVAHAALVLGQALMPAFYHDWLTANETGLAVGLIRELGFAGLPLVVCALVATRRSLQLVPGQIRQSINHRFRASDRESRRRLATFVAIVLLALAAIAVSAAASRKQAFDLDGNDHPFPLLVLSLSWLPLGWLGLLGMAENQARRRETSVISSLASRQARRFLLRYRTDSKLWAASVGMRTATFTIDHDPHDETAAKLPATLRHIRQEEIGRCVQRLLSTKLLHTASTGSAISGAIDPEASSRSCLDVLALFACIYLDAAPLVERRLKGLAALFPVLDPELAVLLSPSDIENSLARIEWLFYFDYDWVDQQIIRVYDDLEYGVNAGNLNPTTRSRVLAELEKRSHTGNFIWIGERARSRILMEAPYLAGVIEAWPIALGDDGEEDAVVFLIKFEELIPRMQKYFNLDELRQILQDYEPTRDSRRLLGMIDLQLKQARTVPALIDIVSVVTNYRWLGFREKDIALSLVLKAFHMALALDVSGSQKTAITNHCLRALEMVGYPSQMLHLAQMRKRQIRDARAICALAFNPRHQRFHEAWLYLATLEPKRYGEADILSFLDLITRAVKHRGVKGHPIVRRKCLEAFFNLAQVLGEDHYRTILGGLTDLGRYLVEQNASADEFCYYLDGKQFLEERVKTPYFLTAETTALFAQHFARLYERHGAQSASVMTLTARWKVLMQQQTATSLAS